MGDKRIDTYVRDLVVQSVGEVDVQRVVSADSALRNGFVVELPLLRAVLVEVVL